MFLWILVSLELPGCQCKDPDPPTSDDDDDDNDDDDTVPQTGLSGLVLDIGGEPIEGATVQSGTSAAESGPDGSFTLEISPGYELPVSVDAPGFVETHRLVDVFEDVSSFIEISLLQAASPLPLDATAGGTVLGSRGASLSAPPGAFVDGSGALVDGEVEVLLTPFDPAIPEELEAYPADLRAETEGGFVVELETWGVLDVVVRKDGEELQVAPGQQLDLVIPAPSAGEPPAEIWAWRYDEGAGRWIELASLATYDAAIHSYRVSVDHLTPINCDRPIDTSCVHGFVVDAQGRGVSGAQVETRPAGSGALWSTSTTWTDRDGSYCVSAPRDAQIEIEISLGQEKSTIPYVTGDIEAPVPPRPCPATCQYVPTITLGEGDIPEDGLTCGPDVEVDAFSAACEGLDAFYNCFAPDGACEFDFSFLGGDTVVSFENGARMEIHPGFMGVEGVYIGPDGQICATFDSTVSFDGSTTSTIVPEVGVGAGRPYTLTFSSDGEVALECDGFDTQLTAEQFDLIFGCGGSVRGGGGGAVCEAAPGSFGGECSGGCDDGMICCTPGQAPNACMPAAMCFLYEEYGCDSDYDCSILTERCCNDGVISMCTEGGC